MSRLLLPLLLLLLLVVLVVVVLVLMLAMAVLLLADDIETVRIVACARAHLTRSRTPNRMPDVCPVGPVLLKANSHRNARHDRDRTVLSCLVWRCELSRPDRQTGAFCVRSVSECVGRRSATAGRTPTQNALVGPTQSTPPDTTQTGSSCLVWRAV